MARMGSLVPWAEFCALIEPRYPKVGGGRPPRSMERMLRMYLIANWFNLADEACEEALYDVPAFRDFCRIDLGRERVPDATRLRQFRHFLEEPPAHDGAFKAGSTKRDLKLISCLPMRRRMTQEISQQAPQLSTEISAPQGMAT